MTTVVYGSYVMQVTGLYCVPIKGPWSQKATVLCNVRYYRNNSFCCTNKRELHSGMYKNG